MKRKFLEDLGIEKEVIEKIMAENGNDINTAKSDYDTLKQQLDATTLQITDRDKQLNDLKKSSGDNEALQSQLAILQADNKAAKEKYETDIKELKINSAIKLALSDKTHDADLLTNLFDKSKLTLSEDGKVTGLEDQLKTLKESKGFLFKEESQPSTVIKGGTPVGGTGTPPVGKKTTEMTYSELCAYMETNPGAPIE